ncbi:hypothetical protein [Bacillus sp. AFS040349]|uniref:hypothetical protein n=1 Tax=Bacillus sp. AFS040349 TaxID=2033502 RepID=UPI000BFDB2BC|nr:hypothetical protein [Bacillus sp. AFS040349]PGT91997.1 hypothetical protein COD11_00025 [Bacillus sp. AFS040349]
MINRNNNVGKKDQQPHLDIEVADLLPITNAKKRQIDNVNYLLIFCIAFQHLMAIYLVLKLSLYILNPAASSQ